MDYARQYQGVIALQDGDSFPINRGGVDYHAKVKDMKSLQPRTTLTEDRVFYVRTGGSDLNDGSSNDDAHAFATIQAAVDYICMKIDQAGYLATIQLADGTYDGFQSWERGQPTGTIYIRGNAANPENTIIQTALMINGPESYKLFLNFLTIHGVGGWGVIVYYSRNAVFVGTDPNYDEIGMMRFTGYFAFALSASFGASMEVVGAIVIDPSASWTTVMVADTRAMLYMDLTSISLISALTFTDFITADVLAYVYYSATSVTGSYIGRKYNVRSNSVLAQVTTVPGSVAGTTSTGGQVI